MNPKTDKRQRHGVRREQLGRLSARRRERQEVGIPFVGLMPSPGEAGIFKLVPTRSEKPPVR
jgi:hypothetical protein